MLFKVLRMSNQIQSLNKGVSSRTYSLLMILRMQVMGDNIAIMIGISIKQRNPRSPLKPMVRVTSIQAIVRLTRNLMLKLVQLISRPSTGFATLILMEPRNKLITVSIVILFKNQLFIQL